ncbi:MAG: OmpA family protein [Muribaculaceae bacterium]|nr:OmpA family protein [Muribaculaceae bacterium]
MRRISVLFALAVALHAAAVCDYAAVRCSWPSDVGRGDRVVREALVNNNFNAVVDVFFHKGSSSVTSDQMANVERIASYMIKNPGANVQIKGYASRDGAPSVNYQLAARRAEAVARLLTGRFRISPGRISASGAGIGEFFENDSWNRVCVCTFTD